MDIANKINKNIQVTSDSPEANIDSRMPVLDLKVWIQHINGIPQIVHTFYKKPIASPYTILKKSAIPEGTKKATPFQEVLRRLYHISSCLPWSESVKHISKYSNAMRISGYSASERYRAIRGATMRYEEMKEKVRNGEIRSLNRKKEEIRASKTAKGGMTSSSWYLKGKTERVMYCQATPGGTLAAKLKKAVNEVANNDKKTLIVEEGGTPVLAFARKTDPFRKEQCRYEDDQCIVESKKDCATMGAVYEITCDSCQDPINLQVEVDPRSRDPGQQNRYNYIGMTRTSVHCRMNGHLKGQRSKLSSNPLWRHDDQVHEGVHQSYTTRILSKERNLLPLTIKEGLYIERQVPKTTLNDRNEFGRGSLIRLTAERSVT